MKIHLAFTAIILAAAAVLGWLNNRHLASAREAQTKLAAEAATLGIALDSSLPSAGGRVTKRGRERGGEDPQAIAGAIAADVFAMAMESGLSKDAKSKRIREIVDRVMALDPPQLKSFCTTLCAAQDLTDESRQEILRACLSELGHNRPQATLTLLTEVGDLLRVRNTFESPAYYAISGWARKEPIMAMDWLRKNGEKFPRLISDDLKISNLYSITPNDPQLALKAIGELSIQDKSRAIYQIGYAPKTPAARTACLAAIHDYLATLPDEKARNEATKGAMGGLSQSLETEGYAAATQWITREKFSPAELENLATEFQDFQKTDGAGVWIDWMSANLPASTSVGHIDRLVRKWTQADYPAAGKWLSTTPAGPTKNAAIRSYAETVSTVDPATATQWAMTLPPGPDRDATLKHIQDKNPAK